MQIKRPIHEKVGRAQGFHWLMRYINGESITKIVNSTGRSRPTIKKYMRKAADLMVDAAQERILQDVFPLVLDVYKAHLLQQLTLAKEGKPMDMTQVERLLKGMYIFDAPQLKDSLKQLGEGETETLEGYMVRKTRSQLSQPAPTPAIEGSVVATEVPSDETPEN